MKFGMIIIQIIILYNKYDIEHLSKEYRNNHVS